MINSKVPIKGTVCLDPVLGILFQVKLGGHGGLSIGGRRDHLLDRSLDVPSIVPEIGGKPVEKIGMGRPTALGSEVARSVHDASAKNGLPVAVGGDAGRERVLRARQPLGHP